MSIGSTERKGKSSGNAQKAAGSRFDPEKPIIVRLPLFSGIDS